MRNLNFKNRIFPSITGETSLDWFLKLEEVNNLKIKTAAVFLSRFDEKERSNLYRLLTKSTLKEIPFVHIRHDLKPKELDFFIKKYKTKYFNIHEENFKDLLKWKGYLNKIYLEMDYDNKVSKEVKVEKLGGFCIDLAHFKSAIAKGTEEAYYIYLKKDKVSFLCNHISGYNSIKRDDKHRITDLKDFDYLTTLPKYAFGKVLAIEVENSIKEQLEFKEYLVKILNDYFSQKTE